MSSKLCIIPFLLALLYRAQGRECRDQALQGGGSLAFVRVVMASASPLWSLVARWVGARSLRLFVAGLVDGGTLGNTVIVALPGDVRVCGEGEHALDRFSDGKYQFDVPTV